MPGDRPFKSPVNGSEFIRRSLLDHAAATPSPSRAVVSLVQDEAGRLSGVVELVRTGRKARVQGVEAIGAVIQAMLAPGAAEDAGAS